jgi:hypothetical protein
VESSWKKKRRSRWLWNQVFFFFFFFFGGPTTWPQSREDKVFFLCFSSFILVATQKIEDKKTVRNSFFFSFFLSLSLFVLIGDFRSRLSNEFFDELERTTKRLYRFVILPYARSSSNLTNFD